MNRKFAWLEDRRFLRVKKSSPLIFISLLKAASLEAGEINFPQKRRSLSWKIIAVLFVSMSRKGRSWPRIKYLGIGNLIRKEKSERIRRRCYYRRNNTFTCSWLRFNYAFFDQSTKRLFALKYLQANRFSTGGFYYIRQTTIYLVEVFVRLQHSYLSISLFFSLTWNDPQLSNRGGKSASMGRNMYSSTLQSTKVSSRWLEIGIISSVINSSQIA